MNPTPPEGLPPNSTKCTLCAAVHSPGFHTGCLLHDVPDPSNKWDCDGKGNLTLKAPAPKPVERTCKDCTDLEHCGSEFCVSQPPAGQGESDDDGWGPHRCVWCKGPMTQNPHPDAGKLDKLLEVGAMWECLPCCFGRSMRARDRASKAETALAEKTAEVEATTNQLYRICMEGFGNDDTIGGESADDYVIRKLTTLRAENERMKAWLPIESAPKDKALVVLWDRSGDYQPYIGVWRHGWKRVHDGAGDFYPTHWKPLPPAPVDATEGVES